MTTSDVKAFALYLYTPVTVPVKPLSLDMFSPTVKFVDGLLNSVCIFLVGLLPLILNTAPDPFDLVDPVPETEKPPMDPKAPEGPDPVITKYPKKLCLTVTAPGAANVFAPYIICAPYVKHMFVTARWPAGGKTVSRIGNSPRRSKCACPVHYVCSVHKNTCATRPAGPPAEKLFLTSASDLLLVLLLLLLTTTN